MAVKWKLDGKPNELRDHEGKPGRQFALISYQGSSPDNLIGKAIRKALKATFEVITRSESLPDGEADEAGTLTIPAQGATRTDALAARLGQKTTNGAGEAPASPGPAVPVGRQAGEEADEGDLRI